MAINQQAQSGNIFLGGLARRLVAEGLANDEIKDFVECFGDYAPACCDECGHVRPIALVTRHGERFCAQCQ